MTSFLILKFRFDLYKSLCTFSIFFNFSLSNHICNFIGIILLFFLLLSGWIFESLARWKLKLLFSTLHWSQYTKGNYYFPPYVNRGTPKREIGICINSDLSPELGVICLKVAFAPSNCHGLPHGITGFN